MKNINLMNIALVVTVMLFGSTFASAEDVITETKVAPVTFTELDKNNDDVLSKAEIHSGNDERLKLAFDRIDSNQDGVLDEAEFNAAISN